MIGDLVYRLFLFDGARLVGHQEFAAGNLRDARLVGTAIFKACGDTCNGYEIWHGRAKLITGSPQLREEIVHSLVVVLAPPLQELATEAEERIANSRWAIARSKRLLSTLSTTGARTPVPAPLFAKHEFAARG